MAKQTGRSSEMVNISAQIPAEIAEILGKVSKAEERSKSYYIRKGLELFLMSKERLPKLIRIYGFWRETQKRTEPLKLCGGFWRRYALSETSRIFYGISTTSSRNSSISSKFF